jgi:hypothetical protein
MDNAPMVVSMAAIFSAFSELQVISQYQELIDLELIKMGAFTAAEMTPQLFAAGVKDHDRTSHVPDPEGEASRRESLTPPSASGATRRG